ncbi:MAG: DEAD/DEAH box helicase [Gammaproteobacteria bacterium]|nr:DEAD/DEAH box helicase [Gammaproteobacteria bacterium]
MFSSLLLDESLLDAVAFLGFTDMTEVQQAAIPRALAGRDLIVNAKTGSGKTLAYLLPLLQQILDNPQPFCRALILAPTRELCRQINKQCSLLAKYTDIKAAAIIGGEDPRYQIKALQKHPEIIIATPGRLLEHAKREAINLETINILVIDEADRMLDMGFGDDVIKIANQCNDKCQTVLYSASFNQKKFKKLTEQILYQPEIIMADSTREYNNNVIQQKILADNKSHKLELCASILTNNHPDLKFNKAVVFANKKDTVNETGSYLQSNGINCAVLHGDVNQDIRNNILRKFRNNGIDIIIATDVVARGLDINGLDLIINFDVPRNGEDYMHRIGRTGRMFDTGLALTLVDSIEWNRMISIENFLNFECVERKVQGLAAKYTGPENRKSSGKAYGPKRKNPKKKKAVVGKKAGQKAKDRLRSRKNIGKRRKPSEKLSAE